MATWNRWKPAFARKTVSLSSCNFHQLSGKLHEDKLTVFLAKAGFHRFQVAICHQDPHYSQSVFNVDPYAQIERFAANHILAGKAGNPQEGVIDIQINAIRESGDRHGVWI